MMPLPMADVEIENIVRKVGGSPEVKKHLEDLGFVPGATVRLVNVIGDNVIVSVKESRIAINSEMARRIMV